MTAQQTTQEQRGAGTGVAANVTRDRQYNETVPGAAPAKIVGGSYPQGDIAKGRIDPDNPDRPIAMRDRRAYLVDQAQKNQDANDELNAIQTEQNERAMEGFNKIGQPDPDEQRESSMEAAVAALKSQDPDERGRLAKDSATRQEKRRGARESRVSAREAKA